MSNFVVTNNGLNWLLSRAFNPDTSEAPVLAIAIGSGSTAPTAADEELVAETARVEGEYVVVGDGSAKITASIPAGEGTGTVAEIGIYTDVDDDEGILVARGLVGPFPKAAEGVYNVSIPLTAADANA